MQKPEIDRFIQSQEKREKALEEQKAQQAEYKRALNHVFGSGDGQLVLKEILKFTGLFHDGPANPEKLLEKHGRQSVYLSAIRPFLDSKIRMEIENI